MSWGAIWRSKSRTDDLSTSLPFSSDLCGDCCRVHSDQVVFAEVLRQFLVRSAVLDELTHQNRRVLRLGS